jgi:DNA-binding NtrC family response regulator
MAELGDRVLVVDDDQAARRALALVLSDAGYHVSEASNGHEALAAMGKRRYAVILTDYLMPGMNGLRLLRTCRMLWPFIPVILLSGAPLPCADPVDQWGAYACLEKPYDSTRLLQTVREAIEGAQPSVTARGSGRGLGKDKVPYKHAGVDRTRSIEGDSE